MWRGDVSLTHRLGCYKRVISLLDSGVDEVFVLDYVKYFA